MGLEALSWIIVAGAGWLMIKAIGPRPGVRFRMERQRHQDDDDYVPMRRRTSLPRRVSSNGRSNYSNYRYTDYRNASDGFDEDDDEELMAEERRLERELSKVRSRMHNSNHNNTYYN